jgi:hypothetical protein
MWFVGMGAIVAFAGASGSLQIDNDFEGEVEVFVDGRYEATVGGGRQLHVDVRPGRHDVVARRPRGGAVLTQVPMLAQPGTLTVVRVEAPSSRLRIMNEGSVPLSVDLGPGDDVWIAPNVAVELRVTAGTVRLVASANDRDGLRRVHEELVWVEPGPRTDHVLRYTPPPPTRLVLHNRDREPVRAIVAGAEVGWVPGGGELVVPVEPGWSLVRFYDPRGRLVVATDVRAERGQRTAVVAGNVSPPRASSCVATRPLVAVR